MTNRSMERGHGWYECENSKGHRKIYLLERERGVLFQGREAKSRVRNFACEDSTSDSSGDLSLELLRRLWQSDSHRALLYSFK